MVKLPWIVRKVIDWEAWLNVEVLGKSRERSLELLIQGARTYSSRSYIQETYGT